MAFYTRRPKTVEAYQFSGDAASPGWPEGWLDQSPSFEVEMDVPPDLSSPTSSSSEIIMPGKVEPLPALPRAYSDAPAGQQVLTIAGMCTLHEANPGDWVVRQTATGEYYTLSDEGFQALFQEV